MYDGSGNERVRLGLLANGDYGLQVIDVAGNSEEILPAVAQNVDTSINITSTTYVASSGPSVTATVGASGKVRLDASAYINPATGPVGSSNQETGGVVGLYIDGAFLKDVLSFDTFVNDPGATSILINGYSNSSTIRILTALSAGSHTFELRYKTINATNGCNFAARSLIVTPI